MKRKQFLHLTAHNKIWKYAEWLHNFQKREDADEFFECHRPHANIFEWSQTSSGLGMYTKDRYFSLPAPNWIGTGVPLRFWTNSAVICGLFVCLFYFFMIFFIGMWHRCFLKVYPTVMITNNNKLRDLTSQKRNRVPLPRCCSLQLAGLLTLLALLQQLNTPHFSFTLCALIGSGDVAYPEVPLDTVRCVTAPIRFCSAVRHQLHFESFTAQWRHGGQLALQGRRVSAIIT